LAEAKPVPPARPVEPKQAAASPKPEPVPEKPEPRQAEAPTPEPPKPVPQPPPPKAQAPKPPEPRQAKPVETKPAKARDDKPVEPAKVEAKPEEPRQPVAEKAEASDFDALLRSVEAQTKRVTAPEKREGKGTAAEVGGTGQPGEAQVAAINPSVLVASISRQITPCWNIPIAAQGIGGLRAELDIQLGPDGSVQSVAPTEAGRMRSDPVFRAFAESAVRAVRACSPLKLPPESYHVWRNIIFNFDPSLMAG
jgi:outer membrane biosynthesis protein TonB